MLRSWLSAHRRHRRIRAAKTDTAPLREFVYLDEISVYSLLASRQGALASEYTDVRTATAAAEVGSISSVTAGVLQEGQSSKIIGSDMQSVQVVRHSTIQAAFKELREGEDDKLAISPLPHDKPVPPINTWAEMSAVVDADTIAPWIIDPSRLTRGQLIEVEIELSADDVFKISSAVAAMVEIFKDNALALPPADREKLLEIAAINRVLDKLLVGLVPIYCRAVEYRVIQLDGKELIIHERLLRRLPENPAIRCCDLNLVGVTEQRLFWKDLRRVLFSGAQFRMMCRLNHGRLRSRWLPIKLVDVVGHIAPGLDRAVEQLGTTVFTQVHMRNSSDSEMRRRMREALISYAVSLAAEGGVVVDPASVKADGLPTDAHCGSYGSSAGRRAAFAAIEQYLRDSVALTIDPDSAVALRQASLVNAGIDSRGRALVANWAPPPPAMTGDSRRYLLDTEVVAIYW